MTLAVSAEAVSQPGRDPFTRSTKVTVEDWTILLLMTALTAGFAVISIFGDWVVILVGLLVVIFGVFGTSSIFWGFIGLRRNGACDQCFQLAEDIGLPLTQQQVVELQRVASGGGVFKQFVGMIPPERLAQPKLHYFAVGDWHNSEHCRRFVRFLHENQDVFHGETSTTPEPETAPAPEARAES